VSLQAALMLQLCVFSAHSFTELHDTPDPVQPALHEHTNDPSLLMQDA
jgi:hypothetical protein